MEFTCNWEGSNTRSETWTGVFSVRYASVADFVGDAPRIVYITSREARPLSSRTSITQAGQTTTVNATYTYDADRRLTRLQYVTDSTTSVQNITGWDQFGRPTAYTVDGNSVTLVYDDVGRSMTYTNALPGSGTVRFDANGIIIGQTDQGPNHTTTRTIAVRSTATVCR